MWIKSGLIMKLSSSIMEFPLNFEPKRSRSLSWFNPKHFPHNLHVGAETSTWAEVAPMLIRPKQSGIFRRTLIWEWISFDRRCYKHIITRCIWWHRDKYQCHIRAVSLWADSRVGTHTFCLQAAVKSTVRQLEAAVAALRRRACALTCSYDSLGGR